MRCVLCQGEITEAHRACMMRSVIGGIGHLEDHDFWCAVMNDPDGGRTYYQSALEVAEWVTRNGVPGVASD
jgi:hypothetical protein